MRQAHSRTALYLEYLTSHRISRWACCVVRYEKVESREPEGDAGHVARGAPEQYRGVASERRAESERAGIESQAAGIAQGVTDVSCDGSYLTWHAVQSVEVGDYETISAKFMTSGWGVIQDSEATSAIPAVMYSARNSK